MRYQVIDAKGDAPQQDDIDDRNQGLVPSGFMKLRVVQFVDQSPKKERRHHRKEDRMGDTSMKGQRLDIIHKRVGEYIQIRYGAPDGSPHHGPVANLTAKGNFADRSTKNDLCE